MVQPTFWGKLGLEIGVFQKAPSIGGSFGEVWSLYTFWLCATGAPVNGRRMELNLIMHPTHPKYNLSGMSIYMGLYPYFDLIMSTECLKYNIFDETFFI